MSVEPPMYGRDCAGHRLTSATYHPADTVTAIAPTTKSRSRFQTLPGIATRITSPKAGSTRNACSSLARNANPIAVPAKAIHRVECVPRSARTTQYPPATSSSTSSASGLLNRNMSAATGVSASAVPASNPAPGPLVRRTAA